MTESQLIKDALADLDLNNPIIILEINVSGETQEATLSQEDKVIASAFKVLLCN